MIARLGLRPHPEGGHYREIFRSTGHVKAGQGRRSAMTLIYFLLRKGERSLFHRVLSDEIWHHCEGAPLRLITLPPNLKDKRTVSLGSLRGRTAPVAVVPAGYWQAAETRGAYTLVACAVAPGFDFKDFQMVRDNPRASANLRKTHPTLIKLID